MNSAFGPTSETSLPFTSGMEIRRGEYSEEATAEMHSQAKSKLAVRLTLFTALAIGLAYRVAWLGHVFHTSDNAALAVRCVDNSGIAWSFTERYGLLNPLSVKLWSVFVSNVLGANLTEFWFKLPVALVGTAQVWVSAAFARKLGASPIACGLIALGTAVFPLHVMQSRYLWGYEVYGLMALCWVCWTLIDFFEQPSNKRSLLAGVATAIYLVSHGYIVPFFPSWILILGTLGGVGTLHLLRMYPAFWVVPTLYLPLTAAALEHTAEKKSQLGFYVIDYLEPMLANVGAPFALVTLLGAGTVLANLKHAQLRVAAVLLTVSGLYMAPLLFGAKPGITVARGYMLVGSYLGVFASTLILDRSVREMRSSVKTSLSQSVSVFGFVMVLATAWGAFQSVFLGDKGFDPTWIRIERGRIPADPGSKVVGLYVREELPRSASVVVLHQNLERPNSRYYLGSDALAWNDKPTDELRAIGKQHLGRADVFVTSPIVAEGIDFDGYELTLEVFSAGVRRAQIYARPELRLAKDRRHSEVWNERFDERVVIRSEL